MKLTTVTGLVFALLCLSVQFMISQARLPPKRSKRIDNLNKYGLVRDLIEHQPSHSVILDYGKGKLARQGNELKMLEVRSAPRLFYPKAKKDKLYTIVMLDPDASSGIMQLDKLGLKLVGPFLHYMVINAPRANNLAGDTIVPYLSPAPSPGSGYHRYTFLVYEQTAIITDRSLTLPHNSRIGFSLIRLSHSSELVGPVAANFFRTRFSRI